jgi:hypothetical protein
VSRADLLALTPETLATLANVGLVKRAQRELASGAGPSLVEEADGTVIGTFADGVIARLVPGKTLRETPCSCNAATTCRHRVAVALAYPAWHAATNADASATAAAPNEDAWSPAEIDDVALERALGAKALARARAVVRAGLLVTTEAAPPPTAKLPSCTVRFLVPRDVAYARCDCVEQGGCEHIALAVWAFRAAKRDGVVALGGSPTAALDLAALDDARAIAGDLVASGVAGPVAHTRFARARAAAESAKMVWIATLLSDLEQTLEAYHARSALYSNAEVRRLALEIEARVRAVRSGAELPPRYILGEDEAPETLLDHVRLVSIGARVRADGTTRFADVFLADPDTASVLVLTKRWMDCADDGPILAKRSVGARITLGQLAGGQLVSKAVKRRANRSVEVGTTRANQSSVTPQHGAWDSLGSIVVRDLAAHAPTLRDRPPWMLRPRLLAENAHVLAVGNLDAVSYVPAEQAVVALMRDEAGNGFRATVAHRAVAPYAVDAAAASFSQPVRFVSGDLSRDAHGFVLDVLAIAGDTMVVPDVAGPVATPAPTLDRRSARAAADPIEAARERANGVLEELIVGGAVGASVALVDRTRAAAAALRDVGLLASAVRMNRLADLAKAKDRARVAGAWFDAAVRMEILADVDDPP